MSRLRDPLAVAIGIGIYFDNDLFNGRARRPATADRRHLDKSRRFQFCRGARQVRLSPSGDPGEFRDRSGYGGVSIAPPPSGGIAFEYRRNRKILRSKYLQSNPENFDSRMVRSRAQDSPPDSKFDCPAPGGGDVHRLLRLAFNHQTAKLVAIVKVRHGGLRLAFNHQTAKLS